MPFALHEPFPSRPAFTGRGGAGNSIPRPSQTTARPAPPTNTLSNIKSHTSTATASSSRPFLSGRGGAGNAHPASQRALFSFDEELDRLGRGVEAAPVYHIGRGGAGNLVQEKERVGSSASSVSSAGSGRNDSNGSERPTRGSLEWVREHLPGGRN